MRAARTRPVSSSGPALLHLADALGDVLADPRDDLRLVQGQAPHRLADDGGVEDKFFFVHAVDQAKSGLSGLAMISVSSVPFKSPMGGRSMCEAMKVACVFVPLPTVD